MKKRYEQPEIVFGNYAADIVMASVGMPESLGDGDWGGERRCVRRQILNERPGYRCCWPSR